MQMVVMAVWGLQRFHIQAGWLTSSKTRHVGIRSLGHRHLNRVANSSHITVHELKWMHLANLKEPSTLCGVYGYVQHGSDM